MRDAAPIPPTISSCTFCSTQRGACIACKFPCAPSIILHDCNWEVFFEETFWQKPSPLYIHRAYARVWRPETRCAFQDSLTDVIFCIKANIAGRRQPRATGLSGDGKASILYGCGILDNSERQRRTDLLFSSVG